MDQREAEGQWCWVEGGGDLLNRCPGHRCSSTPCKGWVFGSGGGGGGVCVCGGGDSLSADRPAGISAALVPSPVTLVRNCRG